MFLSFLPRAHFLFRAPPTFICSDLHVENFGAFKGDNRLCHFDINDFDDACLAPFTIDIVRFIAGIYVAAHGLRLTHRGTKILVKDFLLAYRQSVANGKPRWLERSLATGVFRALLRRSSLRTRRELLTRFTTIKGDARRLRIDGKRCLELPVREHRRLRKVLVPLREQLPAPKPGARFFRLLDAAHRIAGNGSLGLPRYMLLVRGPASPDETFVLDLKFAAPSAVAVWLPDSQPDWDEATRVVRIQSMMQAISPALLRAVNVKQRPFVLEELQPNIDRLNLARWRTKPRRLRESIQGMGNVTAWAHLRGCEQYGAASTQALQAYVCTKHWSLAADKLAEVAAARVHSAWQVYCKDYEAGAISAAFTAT